MPVADGAHTLVRVTDVRLCGSDLHWFEEGGVGDAVLSRPLVLGHEIAGVIHAGALAGTPVAVDPAIPCGTCAPCLRGHRVPDRALAGHGLLDGGRREVMAWPTELLHPLPASLSTTDGAVLEPLVEALGHRREEAGGGEPTSCCRRTTFVTGRGHRGGRVLRARRQRRRRGAGDDTRAAGRSRALVRRMKEDAYERGARLVESGRVDTTSLVTARFPLEQANAAFEAAVARQGPKVVVQPSV